MKIRGLRTAVIFLFLIFFFSAGIFGQSDSLRFTQPASSFNKKRFYGVTGGIVGIYGSSLGVLSLYWYKDIPRTQFHFFNDRDEWLGMDKAGHVFNSYYISRWSVGMYRWTGMRERAALLTGGLTGTFLMSSIELLDGFSAKWGFSWWDMLANAGGSAIVIAQEFAWQEQRFVIKISALPQNYPEGLQQRAEYLYGDSPVELFLKDFNAVTIWTSGNVKSFMRKDRRFPHWLNISVGYGAEGLFGGFENRWCVDAQGIPYADCPEISRIDRTDIPRYAQFYLSLDVDFTKVQTKSPAVKVLLHLLNLIKVPSPTLEFNREDGVVFHPLFW